MTEEANARTRKVISLACGSREAAALFSKLHEEMLLEIESKVLAVGHGPANVVQGDCLELPAAPSDVRSRSNKRVVGSYESRTKVTFLRQCAMCLSSRAAFKGRNDGVNCIETQTSCWEGTEIRGMKQSVQLMAVLELQS
jgi:hypothetical protein